MTYEEIESSLTEWEGDVYFVSMLPEFVWSISQKRVAYYHEQSTKDNILQVYQTFVIDIDENGLMKYLLKQEITEEDVLVFCINEEFYPKATGNWIRLTIIKNVKKKINENRRNAIKRVSADDEEDTA